MPSIVLKTKNRTVLLDARPDRPDFRDLPYRPPLVCLPPEHPSRDFWTKHLAKYRKAGLILDQGEEGACTGFGLAAVINHLLYRQHLIGKPAPVTGVSERMLYHLARKYDEWRGEDYEGSSCRGAIKGWFHHGVCSSMLWPYRNPKGEVEFVPPRDGWAKDASQRPLGAYYRVPTGSIADLQAALHEVGAVYVSSDVHRGWDEVLTTKKAIPTIPWKPKTKIDGGHSYALIGYDAEGLIVQNSWGEDWGYYGFARLQYGDWIAHAADAWVAVLSAPVKAAAPAVLLSSRFMPKSSANLAAGLVNGATASAVEAAARPSAWNTEQAITHTLILGNDGRPDHLTVEDASSAAAVERICHALPKEWLAKRKKGDRRVVIYAHGGLNDLGDALARVKVMAPRIDDNGAYPLFVAWQTGYLKSIANIVLDLFGEIFGAEETRKAGFLDALGRAKDYAIEKAAIPLARPVWSQMKQNAVAASEDGGGMDMLATHLASLKRDLPDLEVHVVGHSAGSILLGAFFEPLHVHGVRLDTVSLYAPACTVAFANERYVRAARDGVIDPRRTWFDVLSDQNERDDTVGPYGLSLLYLVSRALEGRHKTPILGMEAAWTPALDKKEIFARPTRSGPSPDIAAWRRDWRALGGNDPDLLEDKLVLEERADGRIGASHGCFDNSIDGIERTLRRITGVRKLAHPIESLRT